MGEGEGLTVCDVVPVIRLSQFYFFYLLFYSVFPPKCSYYSQGLPHYSQ